LSDPGRLVGRRLGRSSIDPITNIAMLSQIWLEQDTGELLTGKLPSRALPVFLHEATHHVCFFSPVHLALALLNMRARRRAQQLEQEGPRALGEERALDTIDVLDDYVRYDCLTRALEPLAEGMALFAEFDALPGSSAIVGETMVSLVNFFGGQRPGGDIWAELRAALQQERSSYPYATRKTSSLTQAMDLDQGGYLAGYLLVKGWWRAAAALQPRLRDSELFLILMIDYLYADFGLVAHLLDPDTSDYGAAKAIVNYLGVRLVGFESSISDSRLDALEEASKRPFHDEAAGLLVDALDQFHNLATDPVLHAAGQTRLRGIYSELAEEAASNAGAPGSLPQRQLTALEQRHLLCLGRLDVEIDIVGGHVRVWEGQTLLTGGPSVPGTADCERTPGSLEIFINPWRWGRFMAYTASLDGRPVLTWFSRKPAPELEARFLTYQTDTAAAAAADRQLSEQLESQLQQDGTAEIIIPEMRSSLASWARQLYGHGALPHVDESRSPNAFERMAEDGLAAILGLDRVRALAWLSLNEDCYEGQELDDAFRSAKVFHQVDGDVWSTAAEIAAIAVDALGEPLIYVADGSVFCTV
jgi:hypothetical protein